MIASGLIARRRRRIIFSDAEGHWQQIPGQREFEITVKMCRGENRRCIWEQLYPAAMDLTPPDACKISPTLWKFNFGCKAPGATVSIFPCQLIITPAFPVAYSRLMHFWSGGFERRQNSFIRNYVCKFLHSLSNVVSDGMQINGFPPKLLAN